MPWPSAVPRGSGMLAVGKPRPDPALGAADDGARSTPVAAERARGAFDVALRQAQADGAGGEHLAVLGDRRDDGKAEAGACRSSLHSLRRAATVPAEEEVVTDDDMPGAEAIDEDPVDEIVGR